MLGPKDALAPGWKFVPVTETVRLAPAAQSSAPRRESWA